MTQSSPSHPIQQRWAFLVGIDAYVDPRFKRLNFCVNDVKTLEALLTKLGYIVVSLYDQHPQENRHPTRDNVEAELQQLGQMVGKHDLLLVHFACHGKLIDGQPILVMRDSREGLLKQLDKRLSVEQVKQIMRGSGASRLFLSLDACHTGVDMGRGDDDLEFIHNVYELAEGFVVMAGSTAQQKALELGTVKHGVYTYYLLKALSGEADRAKKSFVSVDDVEKYVTDQFKRWAASTGLLQEPTIEKSGMGDMILADWRDRTPPAFSMPVSEAQPQDGIAQRSSSQPRTGFEQQRQEKQHATLQSEWNIRTEKLERLRQAFAIETDAARKFQLEKQIQSEEEEIKRLESKLSDIEQDSGIGDTSVIPQTIRLSVLSPEQLEKQELEKEYATLTKKYELLSEQLQGELNEDNRETLRTRRETIKRKMNEVWNKLQRY